MGKVKPDTSYTPSLGCPTVPEAPRFAGTERAHKKRSRDPFFRQDGRARCSLNCMDSLSNGFNPNADKTAGHQIQKHSFDAGQSEPQSQQ